MRKALAIVGAAAVLRLIVAALIPLFPDETYYWEWSRHLAAGYFDHPAGIALLVRAGTALAAFTGVGPSAFAVRLFPVLAGFVGTVALVATAWRLGGGDAALHAAIAVTVLPLAAAGLVLATPDAPLLAATAVGLYLVVRAVQAPPRSRESLLWWALTGLALGAAFSSKYTSILLPMGVTIAIVFRRELRSRLADPGPYVACIVATLVFVPVLLWNARHGWISFAFQVHHGLGAPSGSPVKRELDLLGGQAGLVSPILFVLLAVACARALRAGAAAAWLLAVVAVVSFGFFVVSALRRPVEANWPAPSYIAAIPLLAVVAWGPAGRRWRVAGYWLAGFLSVFVYLHAITGRLLPVPARRDPIARAAGFGRLAQQAEAAQRTASAVSGTASWLGADRYQDASEIAFHAPDHPTVFSVNLSGRANQYDLWPGFPEMARRGDDLVLALDEVDGVHSTVARLRPYFALVRRGALVPLSRRGDVIANRRIWILLGWMGGWPAPPSGLPVSAGARRAPDPGSR